MRKASVALFKGCRQSTKLGMSPMGFVCIGDCGRVFTSCSSGVFHVSKHRGSGIRDIFALVGNLDDKRVFYVISSRGKGA